MPGPDGAAGGWEFVAEYDAAPKLLGTFLDVDPDETYTQSEIADVADVPLKALYLNDVLDEFVDLGVLVVATDPDEYEVEYHVAADSEVLRAAAAFDDEARSRLATVGQSDDEGAISRSDDVGTPPRIDDGIQSRPADDE